MTVSTASTAVEPNALGDTSYQKVLMIGVLVDWIQTPVDLRMAPDDLCTNFNTALSRESILWFRKLEDQTIMVLTMALKKIAETL
jgi:hypothetical protein